MEPGAYRTANGVSITAISAGEMAAVDEIATEERGLSLLQMMENAGRALAEHVLKTTSGTVVVVAGNGGNGGGGGGLVCARHLRNHHRDVAVRLDRPAASLSGAAAHQYGILDTMGVPTTVGAEAGMNQNVAIVVDALIGYGLTGAIRGPAKELVEESNRMDAAVISLDVPSGLDATTGAAPGAVVEPDRILTLALPKTGLTALECPLFLTDISIPSGVYTQLDIPYDPPFGTDYTVNVHSDAG